MSKVQSMRRDSGDPVLEAFTDQTYAWLDELKLDFQQCIGEPFSGGPGILFANDVLVALHHHDAAWALFDVAEFEAWIEKNAPGFMAVMPSMLADLCVFTNFLARVGRIDPERAFQTERRTFELLGIEPTARRDPWPPSPLGPRNRAERRAARTRARRTN